MSDDPRIADMSARDVFAAAALASGLARDTATEYELTAMFGSHKTGIKREEIIAANAFKIADTMLAARKRT